MLASFWPCAQFLASPRPPCEFLIVTTSFIWRVAWTIPERHSAACTFITFVQQIESTSLTTMPRSSEDANTLKMIRGAMQPQIFGTIRNTNS